MLRRLIPYSAASAFHAPRMESRPLALTTPPRPYDLLKDFPELASYAKPTVRLHPRPGNPTMGNPRSAARCCGRRMRSGPCAA
jgi:hypothetical protein